MLPLLADARFQVLFHSPRRGAFHLSLTVLVHYRSLSSIQPWKMVLPDSRWIARVPRYSGATLEAERFRLLGCHHLWPAFPDRSTSSLLCNSMLTLECQRSGPTTPLQQRLQAYTATVWAVPRSLAATRGISVDFFSSGYLDVSVLPVGFPVPMNSVQE